MNNLFLVLLATRNGAAFIDAQIESVLAQVDVEVRILISDDGSDDGTVDKAKEWVKKDSRITLLGSSERKGSAAANFFYLISKCDLQDVDFVAFCDQDDYWKPQKLKNAKVRMKAEMAVGYSCAVLAQWQSGKTRKLQQNSRIRRADYLFEGAGQGCTFVLDVKLFKEIKYFIGVYAHELTSLHYHDWTIYAISRSLGSKWFFDPEIALTYRQHAANDTGARNSLKGILKRLSLLKGDWYKKQVLEIVNLLHVINSNDVNAATWRELCSYSHASPALGMFRRVVYVLRHGRRRFSDRLILCFCVFAGWL